MMATAADVAKWMLETLTRQRELDQEDAAYEIERRFGKRFIYENDNGNPAISREVLKEFRTLTEGTVVWIRGERRWRFREIGDARGRMTE